MDRIFGIELQQQPFQSKYKCIEKITSESKNVNSESEFSKPSNEKKDGENMENRNTTIFVIDNEKLQESKSDQPPGDINNESANEHLA